MKKVVAIALALAALVASYAVADDDAVYSVNTIGVIKYTIPAEGKLACISMPLDPPPDATSNVWSNCTLAEQLPRGSAVYFWDSENQQWLTCAKGGLGWTAALRNRELHPGEAIFVRQATTATDDLVVSMVGELNPDDTTTINLTGSGNLDVKGLSAYPISTTFTNTVFADALSRNSAVYFWDVDNQQWLTCAKSGLGWTAALRNRVVGVGEGVMVKEAGSVTEVTDRSPLAPEE